MSIWKDLYELFASERHRWQSQDALKNTLLFEIQSNIEFLGDALENGTDQNSIIQNLEMSAFEKILKSGTSINSICKKTIRPETIGEFNEFKKYLGKDTQYLVKNAYSKIQTLKKLSAVNNSDDYGRKLKALLRFLILLFTHIEQRKLPKPSKQS